MNDDLERNVAGIGTLADPVRRRLYRYVCAQAHPVSRDQAAEAVGIARHQAKFHLDRLEAEGLLDTDYVRLTGRTGPGAGRPAKRYRRGSGEFAISVPARDYELAGQIMAEAITDSATNGTPIAEAVHLAAAARGKAIADTIADTIADSPPATDAALSQLAGVLSEHGYEPHTFGDTLVLMNCPFHALVRNHPQLVCRINHALITELAQRLVPGRLDAHLEPGENRCCVTLTTRSRRKGSERADDAV